MFDGFTHFFFDFDGTLCASEQDIRNAWKTAFSVLGVGCPHFDATFRNGPPLTRMAQMLFPDADEDFRERIIREFKVAYDHSPFDHTHPYPGIGNMLDTLRRRGAKLFIVTNKRAKPIGILLEKFGWQQLFDLALSPDSVPGKVMDKNGIVAYAVKHSGASAESSLMIGDTAPDIVAGHVNGIRAAGVLWGHGTREELTAAGADFILSQEDLSL